MWKRNKILEILREEKAYRSYRARTGDHKIRPSIKEAESLAIYFAEIFVESACLRHLPGKLALRQRAEECEHTRKQPHSNQIRRARQIARHLRRRRKYPRADNRADDYRGCGVKTECAL